MQNRIAIIILAAGSSSRLGTPKQLLIRQGKTLIRRIVEMANALNFGKPMVVTGSGSEAIIASLTGLPIEVILNDEWKEGIASSIRAGIRKIVGKGYDGALILVCDQPRLESDTLKRVTEAFDPGKTSLVCCCYKGEPGVPALFASSYFDQLLELKGDRGAKHIIQAAEDRIMIDFEAGADDIDLPGDLHLLN
jgi:molybdenum cofactor cytidylyltransferase